MSRWGIRKCSPFKVPSYEATEDISIPKKRAQARPKPRFASITSDNGMSSISHINSPTVVSFNDEYVYTPGGTSLTVELIDSCDIWRGAATVKEATLLHRVAKICRRTIHDVLKQSLVDSMELYRTSHASGTNERIVTIPFEWQQIMQHTSSELGFSGNLAILYTYMLSTSEFVGGGPKVTSISLHRDSDDRYHTIKSPDWLEFPGLPMLSLYEGDCFSIKPIYRSHLQWMFSKQLDHEITFEIYGHARSWLTWNEKAEAFLGTTPLTQDVDERSSWDPGFRQASKNQKNNGLSQTSTIDHCTHDFETPRSRRDRGSRLCVEVQATLKVKLPRGIQFERSIRARLRFSVFPQLSKSPGRGSGPSAMDGVRRIPAWERAAMNGRSDASLERFRVFSWRSQ